MAKRTRVKEHFPSKFIEIAREVGMGTGKTAKCQFSSHNLAVQARLDFMQWRAALRTEVKEQGPDSPNKELLALAENVLATIKGDQNTVTFLYRDSSELARELEKTTYSQGEANG